MAVVAGKPLAVLDTFTRAMVTGMVAPICAAMGFAAVLSVTRCDQHLVQLLVSPLRRFRWLVVPGGILAAYVVNTAVTSMASTAAALGPILIPLMVRAGVGLEVAGAALILGASCGGDLLNPGAQDVQALASTTHIPASDISVRVVPSSITGMLVALLVFTLLNRHKSSSSVVDPGPVATPVLPQADGEVPQRLNLLKALIPLVPIALVLLAYFLRARLGAQSPLAWLLEGPPLDSMDPRDANEWRRLQGALPVVRAMLIGTLLAGAVGWREIQRLARSLFDGMGSAYGNIISLTITAQCFGAGIAAIGISTALLSLLSISPFLAPFFSATVPWGLAVLSGSGSGSVQAFGQSFLARVDAQHDVATLCAVTCLAGAYGRTISPVAAVVIYSAGLVGISPMSLVRRLLPAALAGLAAALAMALGLGYLMGR
jgi:DcuC family C4-dicarboxylate transporter